MTSITRVRRSTTPAPLAIRLPFLLRRPVAPATRVRWLLMFAALGCSRAPQPSAAQSSGVLVPSNSQVSANRQNAITTAIAKVAPSVVTVQTEAVDQSPQDPFDAFFGRAQPRTQAGLGTGFIVRADGVIVTNAHVVAGATKISVMMRDGTVYPARVLGSDETNDIAVVKIDAKNLPDVKLGNSNELVIGEWAIAIGNPYGFYLGNSEPSVSVGVISATQRNLVGATEGQGSYFDMIQTDAAINPGNSGGPLVDADGDVVGVNSNIFTPNGGSIGLAFAIPINRVARVVDDLLAHGSIRSPWIGVRLQQVQSSNPRDQLSRGAVIAQRRTRFARRKGRAPARRRDSSRRLARRAQRLRLERGAARSARWIAGAPARASRHARVRRRRRRGRSARGDRAEGAGAARARARDVTPAIASDRGLRTPVGALIYNVSQTIAEQTGLQQGDVILRINGSQIRTAQDVARAIEQYGGRTYLRVYVDRSNQLYVTTFAVR